MIESVLIVLCLALFVALFRSARRGTGSSPEIKAFANVGEQIHTGKLSKKATAAYGRNLLVKFGADVDHVSTCAATDVPIGVLDDESAAADDQVNVNLLGNGTTILCTANAAITAGNPVYAAASGKVAPSGTVLVGIALKTVTTDGDLIEVNTACAARGNTVAFFGIHTWAGGVATTDAATVTGVLTTDAILVSWNLVAGTITAIKAVPTANTITFTTSANMANGDKIAYAVLR